VYGESKIVIHIVEKNGIVKYYGKFPFGKCILWSDPFDFWTGETKRKTIGKVTKDLIFTMSTLSMVDAVIVNGKNNDGFLQILKLDHKGNIIPYME
jgi:hypothetical protein